MQIGFDGQNTDSVYFLYRPVIESYVFPDEQIWNLFVCQNRYVSYVIVSSSVITGIRHINVNSKLEQRNESGGF